MKKVLIIIGIGVTAFLGWFLTERPEPPFVGATDAPASASFKELAPYGVILDTTGQTPNRYYNKDMTIVSENKNDVIGK